MHTNEFSRAVGPVVGVILIVAITVALSGVVGVFVFQLGQGTSNAPAGDQLGTRITNNNTHVTVTVVSGTSDSISILVNGNEKATRSPIMAGDTLSAPLTTNAKVTVLSVTHGAERVVTTTTLTDIEPTATTEGLIAHYKLTETAGDAIDYAGFEDNATVYGPLQGQTVNGRTAYVFDATDDELIAPSLTDNPAQSQTFTISAWVHANSTNARAIYSTYDRQGTGLDITDRNSDGVEDVYAYVQNPTTTDMDAVYAPTSIVGNWHHITFVRRGTGATNITIYVDGNELTTIIERDESAGTYTRSEARIGHLANDNFGGYFDGSLSDIRIYNRDLSKEEISDLYNATR